MNFVQKTSPFNLQQRPDLVQRLTKLSSNPEYILEVEN
jgi:hypothetical protein